MVERALYLFRHAKAQRGAAGGDFERALAPRGEAAARRKGGFLAAARQVPPLLVCSTARRTRDTLELARHAGHWRAPARFDDALYLASVQGLLGVIRALPDDLSAVMLVGHEPGLSELLAALIGGGSHRLPTAAMARIDLARDGWQEVRPRRGELAWLVPPKLLDGASQP